MTAVALAGAAAGWLVAAALVVVLLRRAEAVARATHELAGPLHAAGLALTLARREGPAPRMAAVALELERAARALDELRGRRADRPELLDAAVLVASQALAWQAAGPLRVTASTGALVHADPTRLTQAVGNLLANAFEHGRGQVELRVSTAPGGVRIAVRDGGPGVPAMPRRTLRAGRAGRGRGLAIAATAARACGGRLAIVDGVPELLLPAATRPATAATATVHPRRRRPALDRRLA